MKRPWVVLAVVRKDFGSNNSVTISLTPCFLIFCYIGTKVLKEFIKKCNLGKGIKLVACFLKLEFI